MAGFVGRRRGLVATMALLAFALPVAAAEPETEPATAATPGDPPSDASTSWGTQAQPPQGTQAQPPQGTQAQPPPAQELATSKDLQRLQESLAALRAQLEVARVDGIAQAREQARLRSLRRLQEERGKGVYGRYCATCHGRTGDGEGPTARFLKVAPRDLTQGEYKWRTTPTGSMPTDADIVRTIERGAPGTSMPAWKGKLPAADIVDVTQYIKTFSPRFEEDEAEDPEDLEPPVEMPATVPVLDAAAVGRGRQLYALMQCWSCHGVDGEGDGPSAATLKDSNGDPSDAYDFTQGRFRSGGSPLDVYRTFTTGENGTPMPSYSEALMVARDSVADLKPHEAVLDAEQMRELRAYIQTLPTSDEIDALPEDQLEAAAAARRWDLVAYVLSLSEGNSLWRWMTQDPYETR